MEYTQATIEPGNGSWGGSPADRLETAKSEISDFRVTERSPKFRTSGDAKDRAKSEISDFRSLLSQGPDGQEAVGGGKKKVKTFISTNVYAGPVGVRRFEAVLAKILPRCPVPFRFSFIFFFYKKVNTWSHYRPPPPGQSPSLLAHFARRFVSDGPPEPPQPPPQAFWPR